MLDDNELALVDPPKRQKRGPSKLKDKPKEPFNVEFNDDGFAIGKHQNDWSTYVGGMARLRISILDDDWSQIKQDQKDALWEIIKKKRAIGKVYAKQQTNYALLGRSGYRGMDVDLSKVELDEALKAKILNITCDRTRNWILARITSPNISTNMEELFRKLVDVDKMMAQGLIPKEKGADPLIVVLGHEHGGRTRTVEDGIGNWLKKMQKEMKKEMPKNAETRWFARDAARDATKEAEIEVESENVETEASNEGRSQKRLKQNSCESTTVVHQEQLKDIKKSIFWDLPYWERLQVRHYLDVMHIEKNVCESLIGLLLNIPGKTKDEVKVRKDMEAMNIKPELAPREIVGKTSTYVPPANEASLATEDARKAKKDMEKKLDDLEHVIFRKQQCVQDAYTRWTSRDDDTADHVFEVPGGMIVGHEDTFNVPISTEDIMKLWNLDGLNSSILLCFECALGIYTWTMAKCNQQQADHSGYYVMRWMYDFVNTHQIHFPKTVRIR
ncbi:hypothetical protein Tco_0215586 [Tanacetum coccineum]